MKETLQQFIERPTKQCTRCGETKPQSDFYIQKTGAMKRRAICKKCTVEQTTKYRLKNIDKMKEAIKKWHEKHPDRAVIANKKYYAAHRDEVIFKSRIAGKSEEGKKAHRLREQRRRKTLRGKINCSVSANIRESLKGLKAGRHWEFLVGYTVDDLKRCLEKNFQVGMSWGNYGEWHIDHIIPVSAFNFKTTEDIDFKRCWALSNLQPMWARENIIKGASLCKPFQPSLAIAV